VPSCDSADVPYFPPLFEDGMASAATSRCSTSGNERELRRITCPRRFSLPSSTGESWASRDSAPAERLPLPCRRPHRLRRSLSCRKFRRQGPTPHRILRLALGSSLTINALAFARDVGGRVTLTTLGRSGRSRTNGGRPGKRDRPDRTSTRPNDGIEDRQSCGG
jgi:hypothetical protein